MSLWDTQAALNCLKWLNCKWVPLTQKVLNLTLDDKKHHQVKWFNLNLKSSTIESQPVQSDNHYLSTHRKKPSIYTKHTASPHPPFQPGQTWSGHVQYSRGHISGNTSFGSRGDRLFALQQRNNGKDKNNNTVSTWRLYYLLKVRLDTAWTCYICTWNRWSVSTTQVMPEQSKV